jgi:hypothetical protein
MSTSHQSGEVCPRCHSDARVVAKLLLIGKASPSILFTEERAGYRRRDQVATDECKQEELQKTPLEQFVHGFYCRACGVGFVADRLLK